VTSSADTRASRAPTQWHTPATSHRARGHPCGGSAPLLGPSRVLFATATGCMHRGSLSPGWCALLPRASTRGAPSSRVPRRAQSVSVRPACRSIRTHAHASSGRRDTMAARRGAGAASSSGPPAPGTGATTSPTPPPARAPPRRPEGGRSRGGHREPRQVHHCWEGRRRLRRRARRRGRRHLAPHPLGQALARGDGNVDRGAARDRVDAAPEHLERHGRGRAERRVLGPGKCPDAPRRAARGPPGASRGQGTAPDRAPPTLPCRPSRTSGCGHRATRTIRSSSRASRRRCPPSSSPPSPPSPRHPRSSSGTARRFRPTGASCASAPSRCAAPTAPNVPIARPPRPAGAEARAP